MSHSRGAFRRILLFALSATVLARSTPADAQSTTPADRPIAFEVELSTSPIRRTNSAFTLAFDLLNTGADAGLDRLFGASQSRGTGAVLGRLARLWFVNLPIAALLHGFAHDYGHFMRLEEVGIHARDRTITMWPWPIPIAQSVENFGAFERLDRQVQLGIIGAGEQASLALKQTMTDRIYSTDRATVSEWILFGYAALDFPGYGLSDLAPSNYASFDAFFTAGVGDFGQYAALMASLDPEGFQLSTLQRHASDLRRIAWLNFADYALFAAVWRLGTYVVSGKRVTTNPTLRAGRLRLVAGAHASLTANGPAKGFDVRLVQSRYLSHLTMEWTRMPDDRQLWSAGLNLRSRDTSRLLPEGRVDVWEQPGGGTGGRIEIGARRALPWLDGRLDVSARGGYKTEGYVADAPQKKGAQFSVTLGVRR